MSNHVSVTTPPPLQPERIVVQVAPKVIELPTNQAKLTAFPIPDNPKTPYEFEWQLESGPSKGEKNVLNLLSFLISLQKCGTRQIF